jgi:hypothetical protein
VGGGYTGDIVDSRKSGTGGIVGTERQRDIDAGIEWDNGEVETVGPYG